MQEIAFTKVSLPYGWLGNMSPYPVTYDGKVWKTTEALFQALRFEDEEIREALRKEPSPMGCKFRAKAIVKELTKNGELHKRTVEPLSAKDLENMELCVRLKIEQHPAIKSMILSTAGKTIYEDVTSRGRKGSNLFWGALKNSEGSWEGENHLGKIWMKVREEMIDKFRKMPRQVTYHKFGISEDPYEKLKEYYSKGFIVSILDTETMRWFRPNRIKEWVLPPQCYRVKNPFTEEIVYQVTVKL